ncbi:sensor histidine kinase [Georgenia wangjunii]|uniref:sensor histidine kinase n=1 Tax=Georgenia wangjunii TaxID=3117730 RepID=UPI002F267FB3
MREKLRARWRSVPLRGRIVALLAALLAVGLALAGTMTATVLRSRLVEQVDSQLEATARTLNWQTLNQLAGGTEAEEIGFPSDYYVRIVSSSRGPVPLVTRRTVELYGTPQVALPDLSTLVASDNEPVTVDSDAHGSPWRALTVPARVPWETERLGALTLALPLASVEETVARITRFILVSGLLIIGLGSLGAWVGVRRALRPLREIEATAGAIAAGDLSRRVPPSPSSTEVGRLSTSLNAMLAHIERAFAAQAASEARMRRFVSDASHELRTPLATVRGYGELYRMGAIPPEELPNAMRRIEGEATRMGTLVADLLQLARMDEGRPPERLPVDLRVLAADAAADLYARDPSRRAHVVPLDPSEPASPAVTVLGDEDALRQVLANLLGNVVQHTPAGTPVELALGTRVDPVQGWSAVVLEVRDHGPGIAPEHAERVFERFYRLDDSRTRASGGSGLGLAIVAAVVAAHGGTVRVLATPGGGTTVRLELPPAPPVEPTP